MVAHTFGKEAGAALVFAITYAVLFVGLLAGYITHRLKWRSRWTLLFFHVTIRVASQALGVAFGILVYDNLDIFIAYLVLSAEGYFTLTIAAYLFLKSWQKHNWGDSWLASDKHTDNRKESEKWLGALIMLPLLTPWRFKHHLMVPIHSLLIPANAIIITGGSLLAGSLNVDTDVYGEDYDPTSSGKGKLAKILRSVGAAIFLAVTLLFDVCLAITIIRSRRTNSKVHPTLLILCVVGLFLIVRGVFGLLQSAIWDLSYTNPANYSSHGFTTEFTALEYCLTVLPEFSCAALMSLTYWTARQDRWQNSSDIPQDLDEIKLTEKETSRV